MPLEHPFNPLTYRFHLQAPWGQSQTALSINVPLLGVEEDPVELFGALLWELAIASAISEEVRCLSIEYIRWKLSPAPGFSPQAAAYGRRPGAPSSRARCGVVMAHSGKVDRLAARRIAFPGMPAAWSSGGMMTETGLQQLELLSKVLIMGCGGEIPGCPSELLVAYPAAVEPTFTNPAGIAFRRAELLVPCWYTMRAPDPPSGG